jgi:ATP-binding protein involved in chromosome partitioning
MSTPSPEQVNAALATVNDPEIKRPITELGMVDSVSVDDAGVAAIDAWISAMQGCP